MKEMKLNVEQVSLILNGLVCASDICAKNNDMEGKERYDDLFSLIYTTYMNVDGK